MQEHLDRLLTGAEGLEKGVLRETELLQIALGDAESPDMVLLREEERRGSAGRRATWGQE